MSRLYSTQFLLGADLTLDGPVGPDVGELWVIRQVTVYSGNTTSVGLSWSLTETSTGAALLYFPFPDSNTGIYTFSGRLVIPYGQQVQWHSGAEIGDAGVDVYVGGYLLTTP